MVTAALERLRFAGFESFAAASEIVRRHFGAEAHIAAEITWMRRTGEDRIEVGGEPVFPGRVRIQDFQPISGLAPDLDIRRMQSELAGQVGARQARRLRERTEQTQVHAQVEEMDGVEPAPPFKNARDL